MTYPYLALEHPIRFAHRGSRVLWPENTMDAFQGASDLGYRYFETDVRISRDGVVVVFHDKTLDRTTNGTGLVSDWLFEDLRHLDAAWSFDPEHGYPLRGSGIGISSLDELFATFPDIHINIDLKGKGLEWPVAEIIQSHGRQDRTLIGSFVDRRIARFRRVTSGTVATSAGPSAVSAMWTASRRGRTIERPVAAYQVPFDYRSLKIDQKYVDAIHRAGAQIHCWTVNAADDMQRLLNMGVDGIVTDRPDILNEVMRERGHDV
jgi:glycerophosphoryl diester phosphodiesterase